MKVKVFLESAGNFDERELLQKFYNGIQRCLSGEDELEFDLGKEYSTCDVAVFMGSWKPRDRDHHIVRTSIAENSKCFVIVETPLLGRVMFQKNKHFRVGVNGFLNNDGFFNYQNHDSKRLDDLGISWKGWKENPNGHILIFLQLPGDASLRGISIAEWLKQTVLKIREKTDRPIVIRTHPGHTIKDGDEFYKAMAELYIENVSNIRVSKGKEIPLETDLLSAFCTVAYSSGSSIDSIVNGIPTIACDPGNFAYDISSNFLEDINNPKKSNDSIVTRWLRNLAYSQWTIDEMSSGIPWNHLYQKLVTVVAENTKKKKK